MNDEDEQDPPRDASDRRTTEPLPPVVENFGAVVVGVLLGVALQSLALLVVYVLMVALAERSKGAGAIGLVLTYLANVVVTMRTTKAMFRSGRRIRGTTFLIVSIVSILLTGSCCVSFWNYMFHG